MKLIGRVQERAILEKTLVLKQVFITMISTFGITANKHSIGLVDNTLELDVLFEVV